MTKLLAVFAVAMVLAYISEKNTKITIESGQDYTPRKDWAFVLLIIVLTLFAGLRTHFNDTGAYTNAFIHASGVVEWLSNPDNYNIFKNPLFYFYQSVLKTLFNNEQMLLIVSAIITQCCFIRFFKRYSEHFLFSIFIYFTLGTYVFTLAALKQALSMAIMTLAFPLLEKRKWILYYLFVFIAMLVHTYSLAFAVLPLFKFRPWRSFTFIFVMLTMVLMLNFESAITAFMEQANDLGKNLAEYEVFDSATINIFRLGVYAVPPAISFMFQKWILRDASKIEHVLVHMSIISLAFMVMGTQSGANMFGRMANYFELGTICYLPKMLEKTFNEQSYKLISIIAVVCFFAFFVYANMINYSFDQEYSAISLLDFLRSII